MTSDLCLSCAREGGAPGECKAHETQNMHRHCETEHVSDALLYNCRIVAYCFTKSDGMYIGLKGIVWARGASTGRSWTQLPPSWCLLALMSDYLCRIRFPEIQIQCGKHCGRASLWGEDGNGNLRRCSNPNGSGFWNRSNSDFVGAISLLR